MKISFKYKTFVMVLLILQNLHMSTNCPTVQLSKSQTIQQSNRPIVQQFHSVNVPIVKAHASHTNQIHPIM